MAMDPEKQFEVAATVMFSLVALFIIYMAIRALCLIGTIGCCLCETFTCCARGCRCCIRCLTCGSSRDKNEESEERKEDPTHSLGNWGSMLLVIFAIIVALIWQFYIAKHMAESDVIEDAWTDYCSPHSDQYPRCMEYAATYRVSFAIVILFVLMAIITAFAPALHDRGWDLKIILFLGLCIAFIFAKNRVFDDHGYVWFARIGAFVFLILQQIILIDYAYTINERLISAGDAEQQGKNSAEGGMSFSLWVLLSLSLTIFAAAFIGIVLLFVYFTGCNSNNSFISITLLLVIVFTALQLTSNPEQGHNLLTSSVVAFYAVYLTYVSVSSNPVESCNPFYDNNSNNELGIILGLGITFVSLCATTYFASGNLARLVSGGGDKPRNSLSVAEVLTSDVNTKTEAEHKRKKQENRDPEAGSSDAQEEVPENGRAWKFNLVLVLICMYWCMVLTNWGNSKDSANSDSPRAGRVTCWINIVACWMCMGIYMWTLLAPRLFPNRDFSG